MDITAIPLERLEAEIATQAAHIAAATCRWLELVAEFDRREGYADWGCRSTAHWLNWRCGIGVVAAREHVKVGRRLAELPGLRAAFASGELSYSKARAVVRVATPETEATLVEWARHATAPLDRTGTAISIDTAARLACDAATLTSLEQDGDPLRLGRATREPNRAQRRALRRRDGGCRFPGCTQRRWVQAHHIVHWTNGGPTDLDNLVLLCWRHHRLVHEGGWSMTGTAADLVVRRPDGSVVPTTPPPTTAHGPDVVAQNRTLGLTIT